MKTSMLSLIVVVAAAGAASGQTSELNLFYDVRPSAAEILTPAPPYIYSASLSPYVSYGIGQEYPLSNGGGRGDEQMVFLSPKLEDVTDYTGFGQPDGLDEHFFSWDEDVDWSKGVFYLYAEYEALQDFVATGIGVDQAVPSGAFATGNGFYLRSVVTTLENTSIWDASEVTGGNALTRLKMVKVPLEGSPPVFDSDAGIGPGDLVQVAKVTVESEYRNGETAVASWGVKLTVNGFLCSQFHPTDPNDVTVNFGYVSGSAELGGPGSQEGTTSTEPDMVIMVVRKGDFNLNGVACDGDDLIAYYAIGAYPSQCNPFELYLADFDDDGHGATSIDDFDYYKHAAGVP